MSLLIRVIYQAYAWHIPGIWPTNVICQSYPKYISGMSCTVYARYIHTLRFMDRHGISPAYANLFLLQLFPHYCNCFIVHYPHYVFWCHFIYNYCFQVPDILYIIFTIISFFSFHYLRCFSEKWLFEWFYLILGALSRGAFDGAGREGLEIA